MLNEIKITDALAGATLKPPAFQFLFNDHLPGFPAMNGTYRNQVNSFSKS